MLDKNIRWNLGGLFPPALKILSNVIGNQVRQHFLKVFMKHGAGGSKRATEILKVTVPNTWPSKKKSLQPRTEGQGGKIAQYRRG